MDTTAAVIPDACGLDSALVVFRRVSTGLELLGCVSEVSEGFAVGGGVPNKLVSTDTDVTREVR